MKINPNKCVACGNCTYVCPMGAIYIDPELKRATINRDECVECYACYNGLSKEVLPPATVRFVRRTLANFRVRFEPEPDVCPTTAFEPDQLEWPRVVRRAFSDPRVPHESTGVLVFLVLKRHKWTGLTRINANYSQLKGCFKGKIWKRLAPAKLKLSNRANHSSPLASPCRANVFSGKEIQ